MTNPRPAAGGVLEGAWQTAPADGLEAAIAAFKLALPGWWFSVCECQVSCDASCAPTGESPDLALIPLNAAFDHGFHADLRQPATLAEALGDVMAQALEAKAALGPLNASPAPREAK